MTTYPEFAKPQARRVYVHARCGAPTVVDGEEYAGLCNPFTGLLGVSTRCVKCHQQRPLREFAWKDTRERLDLYRRRLRGTIPVPILIGQYAIKLFGALGMPMLGALAGWSLSGGDSIVWPTAGGVAGLVIGLLSIGIVMALDKLDFTRFR